MSASGETPVAKLTFEAALAELEKVVGQLESGQVPLEESIALYRRGAELRQHCEASLKAAEEQVALITEGADGKLSTKPADLT
jgi:exodeoxyribonuclease VII small subunit